MIATGTTGATNIFHSEQYACARESNTGLASHMSHMSYPDGQRVLPARGRLRGPESPDNSACVNFTGGLRRG